MSGYWTDAQTSSRSRIQKTGLKEHFPTKDLRKIGYESKYLGGLRSYLAVAKFSHRKFPPPEVLVCDFLGAETESRFLTVKIGDIRVSSVYAPFNAESLKRKQEVIERRVQWLNRLRDHVDKVGYNHRDSVHCGDFNVKFRADDQRSGLYGEDDEDALKELLDLGFVDLYRKAHPDLRKEPGYTRGYCEKYPKGTSRLNLVLASGSLAQCLRYAFLDLNVDLWPREDAPPLVVDLVGVSV